MILVLDTSTSHLSIGLATDAGELLAEFEADATADERGIHDARLASETEKLLTRSGASAEQISRIGIVIGPGSFTGLRIGLSFAKGLAFGTGAGIVALTQHEVLAASSDGGATYLLTPGYRPEQLYVSESETPRNILLMSNADFEKLPARPIVAHSLLKNTFSPSLRWVSLALAPTIIARLTANSEIVLVGNTLDSLEPLYITEFQPGKM